MDTVTRYTLQLQGGRVQTHVKIMGLSSRPGGRRGVIRGFSRASRKRLLDKFASIDGKKVFADPERRPKFLTLTYGQCWPSMRVAKAHLLALKKRLKRAYPGWSGIWRVEFQRRGAPHFHVVLFGLPYVNQSELAWMWAEVIGVEYWNHNSKSGYPEMPVVHVQAIKTLRQLMYYMSKYVSKVALPAERFLVEPAPAADAGASSFTNSAYLAVEPEDDWMGRHWGVWNERDFPFAELVTVLVDSAVAAFHNHFRRLMARKRRWAAPGRCDVGMTLYTDAALPWLDYWLHCLLEYG